MADDDDDALMAHVANTIVVDTIDGRTAKALIADSNRGDSFFTPREFELISGEFERREQAEIDHALNRAGDREIRAMLEIDRLQKLRDTDIDAYRRENGSDKLLALLRGEEDESP